MLFYGPPGTGKTSTILAVARRIYGKDYKKFILEVCASKGCWPVADFVFENVQLNASDDRGIDVVREQIKNFAETRTLFRFALNSRRVPCRPLISIRSKGFKLIILDEADMMTTAAQAALRRSGSSCPWKRDCFSLTSTLSYRAVYQERPVLHHMQLREQNCSCHTVALYAFPL